MMLPAVGSGNKEPHVRRNRRGFTMIEILVAVGIIATLTALLFLGFKYVGKSSRDNLTHTALQNLRGMLTEYETSVGSLDKLERLYDPSQYSGAALPPDFKPASPDFPALFTILAPEDRIPSRTTSVAEDMPARNGPAILKTRLVMNQLLSIPSNQKI